MDLDERVISAVERSVAESGQSDALSAKILAWLRELAAGNESEDKQAVLQRVKVLYEAVEAGDPEDEDE